jgi:hypothetical protein
MSTLWRNPLRLSALIVLAASLFQILVRAQSQQQSVIRVDVNLVMVDTTVKTRAGQIMGDLKQDAFELREDGVPQKIEIWL